MEFLVIKDKSINNREQIIYCIMSRCRCCQHNLDSSLFLPNPSNESLAETFQKLKKAISQMELILDFKIWKRSQWLEKGGIYALLIRAYSLLDTVETRHQTYLLSELYHQGYSKDKLESSRKYIKLFDVDEVLYLINDVYIPHLECEMETFEYLNASNYFETEVISIGTAPELSRFQRLCTHIKTNIKHHDGQELSDRQIVDFSEQMWKKIFQNFSKQLRYERTQELLKELEKSLRYEQKKIEVIKELNKLTDAGVVNDEKTFKGYKGKMLKDLLVKGKSKDDVISIFDRYNNKILHERKIL